MVRNHTTPWLTMVVSIIIGLNLGFDQASATTSSVFHQPSVQQNNAVPVVTVSAASYDQNAIAAESIVAGFGTLLATTTEAATTNPLPTNIAGTSVKVKGSNEVERLAPLFFVSPNQINYVVPAGTSSGSAMVTVTSGDGTISTGTILVQQAVPAMFSANNNGAGVPAAVALRVKQDNSQIVEPIFQFNPGSGLQEPIPIDLGPSGEKVFLILFLSGIRGSADPDGDNNFNETVHVVVGGVEATPDYAGSQGTFAGLDQINLELDRSLIGSGLVSLSIISGGTSSNICEVHIAGQVGGSPPAVSGFNPSTAIAGQTVVISGNGFSSTAAENTVRIGGIEATVNSATSTDLNVTVPYGAQTGPVNVITSLGEGASPGPLNVLTSLSGIVQSTTEQPIPGVDIRVVGSAAQALSQAGGQFLVENPPIGQNLIEVDGEDAGVNPPYPKVSLKTAVYANRDNPLPKPIVLQQAGGPSVPVGNSSLALNQGPPDVGFSAIDQQVRSIETGGVIFEVPVNTTALFPDGSTSGLLTLTLVENGRLPVNLPGGHFSTSIVQITPFGVKLDPGGKLTFPNNDGFPAGSQVTLFKLDQTPLSATLGTIVAAGNATVSADGQRIETAAGAINETAFFFVSMKRPTTTVVGLVVDSDGKTPVRLAVVNARGQEAFTDGAGGFIIRNVPVNPQNDMLTVSAAYLRPSGRVDKASRSGIPTVANGVTKIDPALTLPSAAVNQPPVILAASNFIINQGGTADLGIVVTDPDGAQPPMLIGAGVSFASIMNGNKPGSFVARLTPGAVTSSTNYTLRLTATDEKGATSTFSIAIRVNRIPVVTNQTINLSANGSAQIVLTGTDQDGDKLNFNITSQPVNGTLSGVIPDITFQPFMNYTGADVITFKANDGYAESAQATITLIVNSPLSVTRTLAYHQITTLDTSLTATLNSKPILSGDGKWAVYTIAPGTQDPARPNRIFVTGFDGTQTREVDAYQTYCFCGSLLDISTNGGRIISTDTVRLRTSTLNGGDGFDLLALTSGEIKTIRISGDGHKVFFLLRRNATIRDSNTTLERGLYMINPDGSGRQQVVGSAAIAQLAGVEANTVFPFDVDGPSLDVSEDGSRIVFGVFTGNVRRVYAVNANGSGLKEIFNSTQAINSIGLNATGEIVALRSAGSLGITMQFDGSGQKEVTNQLGAFLSPSDTILTADGSKVLFGTANTHLYSTDGSQPLQLAIQSGLSAFRLNGLDHSSISQNGSRILFTLFRNNILQLGTLEFDPPSLGEAPEITMPMLTPFFVLSNSRSSATLTVKVFTDSPVIDYLSAGAHASYLFNGLLTPSGGAQGLFDNGSVGGDVVAGDGIYTFNSLNSSFSSNPIGSYTVRVRVDVTASDGKQHATAIDFLPFYILADLPFGTPPSITGISPSPGATGAVVTIQGSNFSSEPNELMVIFGSKEAPVLSSSPARITVKVPDGLAAGPVEVRIFASGRSSNSFVFNVSNQ
ncbi:MAG: IPT/TIG domain-containing protein [Acidobacteria bacterium]|nr:IPT/TIG domain-containing protein [Acidobacteriota bacterium]